MITEEFWVLRRPFDSQYYPNITEEFAKDCSCTSTSLNHVCTWFTPEMASRFDSKEQAAQESRLIGLGFTPVKYRMTLEAVEE
jgi:hypothetical protein